jgi:hypothetical protein
MIQPIDEKTARYQIIKLMFEEKFPEAEKLLGEYTASGLMDASYSDFYYTIMEAIEVKPTGQPSTIETPVSFDGAATASYDEHLKSAA